MYLDNHDAFLRHILIKKPFLNDFPFNLPAVKHLESLEFHPNVSFLVGENGTGKSTILEALAICLGLNSEGGSKNFNFATKKTHSDLYEYIKLQKGPLRPQTVYFLRAETLYNLASNIEDLDSGGGLGFPVLDSYGSRSLHQMSHGESILALINHRFAGHGLYILDEPETALSPARQLSLLARIHDLVKEGSQFVIATHSPILITYPKSQIYSLTETGYEKVTYDKTEHFQISRDFLTQPERFLKYLLADS